jgi:hypothetical protein
MKVADPAAHAPSPVAAWADSMSSIPSPTFGDHHHPARIDRHFQTRQFDGFENSSMFAMLSDCLIGILITQCSGYLLTYEKQRPIFGQDAEYFTLEFERNDVCHNRRLMPCAKTRWIVIWSAARIYLRFMNGGA